MLNRLLFFPNQNPKKGYGHWKRCTQIVQTLGLESSGILLVPQNKGRFFQVPEGCKTYEHHEVLQHFQAIVVDQQATSSETYGWLRQLGLPLIGWDEGGAQRKHFDYLVDTLPNLCRHRPNRRLAELLNLWKGEAHFARPIKNVLIVYGGTDPAHLTLRTLQFLQDYQKKVLKHTWKITVVQGPQSQFDSKEVQAMGASVWKDPQNLSSNLEQFDLVICSWGLTALESAAQGCRVIINNPSSYHEKLTQKEGFSSWGVKNFRLKAFQKALEDCHVKTLEVHKNLKTGLTAQEYWKNFKLPAKTGCPICSGKNNPVIFRTEYKTYCRCLSCGMEYLIPFDLPEKDYGEAYFFQDYEKQYGKTYLDDFKSIQNMGRLRLEFWKKTGFSVQGKKILDVGCAYGPFLMALKDEGAFAFGVDISPPAVKYSSEILGFPAKTASFPDFDWSLLEPQGTGPDGITLWYVIEHFNDLDRLLKKISLLLPSGGGFAFSTPNGKGISRRFNTQSFWKQSPDDHYSVWNTQNVRKILRRYGFKVQGIRITGHHPERFPGMNSSRGLFFAIIQFFDQLLGWGDTFEVYARKEDSWKKRPLF